MSIELDTDPLLAPLYTCNGSGALLGGILLKRKIGEGGVGSVYAGLHTRLNLLVAVKILKEVSPANLLCFQREARLTVSLEHPNLVRVLDVNADLRSNIHYIVMEYVEGCSAYELLRRSLQLKGLPLSQLGSMEIVISAARAMVCAHASGILHCDLKPDNILVRRSDGVAKVADLGFASTSAETARKKRQAVGTIGFIAPEVLTWEPPTQRSDLYSLGATLYELCTGALPFGPKAEEAYYEAQLSGEAPDPRTHAPALDPELAQTILRCLRRDPEERFASALQLADGLQGILARLSGANPSSLDPEMMKSSGFTQPTVLLVDDDSMVLDLMSEAVEAAGFRAVGFTSPFAALQAFSEHQPEVAVLDLQMPGMDGVELCGRLRATQGFSDLPVLILSGQSDEGVIRSAMNKGIDDYLLKPASIPEVILRVRLLATLRFTNRQRKSLETQLLKIKRKSNLDPSPAP